MMAKTEEATRAGAFPSCLANELRTILENNSEKFKSHRTGGHFKVFSHTTDIDPFIVVVNKSVVVMNYKVLTPDSDVILNMYHVFDKNDFATLYHDILALINCTYLGPLEYDWSRTSSILEKCGVTFGMFVLKMGGRIMYFQRTH